MIAQVLAALLCTCGPAREVGAWCEVHQVGTIAGLTVSNRYLFDVLDAHGHEVDATTLTCPTCRRAIAAGGFCDEHRIGFAGRRAYFSWLTYALAHGTTVKAAELTCPVCIRNAASSGWCDGDRVGIVNGISFRERAAYDRTVSAVAIVRLANEAALRCQYCAAAIVTDTQCPFCKITYRGGRRVDP